MTKTAKEIRDNRDKLLIVPEFVKQKIGKKYLNQVIGFLDDLAEDADKTPKAKSQKKVNLKACGWNEPWDGRGYATVPTAPYFH